MANGKLLLPSMLVLALPLLACTASGPASDIADMKNKVLTFSGSLQPKGYLGVQLIADMCPMLQEDAIVTINGRQVTTDRGDNSGGIWKGPCYWPGASLSQTDDLGVPLTVEISDHSQSIHAVISPGHEGLALAVGQPLTAPAGGQVVVSLEGPTAAAEPPPIAVAHLTQSDSQEYWTVAARAERGALQFHLPAAPAGHYTLTVSAGIFSVCENATCDAGFLKLPADFSPQPLKQRYDLTITP